MEIKELQRMHGGQTTLINIDYYEELKRKADERDEKETPVSLYSGGFGEPTCPKCNSEIYPDKYCSNCGQKLDWSK